MAGFEVSTEAKWRPTIPFDALLPASSGWLSAVADDPFDVAMRQIERVRRPIDAEGAIARSSIFRRESSRR
jgi:hypothetical protein